MTDMRKVSSGEPLNIPATTHNAFIDATRFVEDLRRSLKGSAAKDVRAQGIYRVKNNSYQDLLSFSVLGIDAHLFDPLSNFQNFRQEVILDCSVPADSHSEKFVILAEPLRNGEIGFAWASDIAPAKIEEATVGGATHVDRISGNTEYLRGGSSGFPIIWIADESYQDTYRWSLIRMTSGAGTSTSGALVGIEIESVNYDTANCRVTYRPCGVSQVEEEYAGHITVYDDLHQCLLNEEDAALIGRRGSAAYMQGDGDYDCRWQLMSLCCPE